MDEQERLRSASLEPTSGVLATRRVRLRAVTDADFPTLFSWRNTAVFRKCFHHNEVTVGYRRFCEEFAHDSAVRKFQFMVEHSDSADPVGLTFAHSYSEAEAVCTVNLFVSEPFVGRGYAVDVMALWWQFLIVEHGIREIYCEAFAFNRPSLSCLYGAGMREIATRTEGCVRNGQQYDVRRFVGDTTLLPRARNLLRYLRRGFRIAT